MRKSVLVFFFLCAVLVPSNAMQQTQSFDRPDIQWLTTQFLQMSKDLIIIGEGLKTQVVQIQSNSDRIANLETSIKEINTTLANQNIKTSQTDVYMDMAKTVFGWVFQIIQTVIIAYLIWKMKFEKANK